MTQNIRAFEHAIDASVATVNVGMRDMHELDKAIETARSDYKIAQQTLTRLKPPSIRRAHK